MLAHLKTLIYLKPWHCVTNAPLLLLRSLSSSMFPFLSVRDRCILIKYPLFSIYYIEAYKPYTGSSSNISTGGVKALTPPLISDQQSMFSVFICFLFANIGLFNDCSHPWRGIHQLHSLWLSTDRHHTNIHTQLRQTNTNTHLGQLLPSPHPPTD